MIRQTATLAIVLLVYSAAPAQTATSERYGSRADRPLVDYGPYGLEYDQPAAEPPRERPAHDELQELALQRQYYHYPYDNCQPRRHYGQAEYQQVAQAIYASPNTPSVTAFRQLSRTFSPAELRAIRLQYNQARIHDRIADNRRRYSN